jgi:hypothetical protein
MARPDYEAHVAERESIGAGIKRLFEARDAELVKHNMHWYYKMCDNRERMGLPEILFDPTKNYIPASVQRDSLGVPTMEV